MRNKNKTSLARISTRSIATVAAAFALLAGLGATTASAATTEAKASVGACTWFGQGELCVYTDTQGYRAEYYRTSPGYQLADFNLWCSDGRWFGDDGAFPINQWEDKTYVFAVGSHGSCYVRLYDKVTGQYWDTASVTR